MSAPDDRDRLQGLVDVFESAVNDFLGGGRRDPATPTVAVTGDADLAHRFVAGMNVTP